MGRYTPEYHRNMFLFLNFIPTLIKMRAGSISGRGKRIFPLASVSRPALGPTQPPVQWVPGVLSPGVKRGRGVTLTTHPHLVPRSRMSRSYTSSSPSASVACSGTALAFNLSRYIISIYLTECYFFAFKKYTGNSNTFRALVTVKYIELASKPFQYTDGAVT
jgi:hypothetical protein